MGGQTGGIPIFPHFGKAADLFVRRSRPYEFRGPCRRSCLSERLCAAFRDKITDEINARGRQITAIGTPKTGLPEARLQGERSRTTGPLHLFAELVRRGNDLARHHDPALPVRKPAPRSDLTIVRCPIGPGRGVRRF